MSFPSASSRLRLVPIVLTQVLGLGCGVAGVRINSHLVPPEVLGVYGVFLTFAPIGSWLVHAGLVRFVGRHWAAARDRTGLWREATAAWRRRLPWLGLVAVGAALAMARLTHASGLAVWLALVIAATFIALAALAQAALQAELAHWRDCAVSVSGSIARTFLPPLLFFATGGIASALWFGFSIHAVVLALVALWALRGYWKRGPTPPATRELTPIYEGPLFIALAIAAWTVSGVNRWLVAGFFGETEAGYFTLASCALLVPSTLGTVFMQYFQPGLFALGDQSPADRATLARRTDGIALAHALMALAAVGLLVWVAPWLIGPLISPRYVGALPWLLPVGCFGTALTTAIFYQAMLIAGRCERACGPVDLTTAGILAAGCIATAACGRAWFVLWLLAAPIVPWLVTRPLARRYFARSIRFAGCPT